jgi:hypothetical protein
VITARTTEISLETLQMLPVGDTSPIICSVVTCKGLTNGCGGTWLAAPPHRTRRQR